MHYLSEKIVRAHVTQADVTAAIEKMYVAIVRNEARNFPTVRESLDYAGAVFGFKSGIDTATPALGVKAGGFWPGNHERGLANHQSTVLLFDPDSGRPGALVRGNHLTALRTAAASAISIRYLARRDAKVLGIVGAGGQSEHQVRAAMEVHPFDAVLIADLDTDRAGQLAERLADLGVERRVEPRRRLAGESDVIITITPSREPVIETAWVRPGTHIACMGADTAGKQELETSLVASARLVVDDEGQAVSIGEMQHAKAAGVIGTVGAGELTLIGDVIAGRRPGRTSARQVTIFDSTGVGLQDIFAAKLALDIVLEKGIETRIE